MIVVTPIAALSSSRPAPGHPPGKVENNRCSLGPLGIRWCYFEHTTVRVTTATAKRIPRARRFLVPLSWHWPGLAGFTIG